MNLLINQVALFKALTKQTNLTEHQIRVLIYLAKKRNIITSSEMMTDMAIHGNNTTDRADLKAALNSLVPMQVRKTEGKPDTYALTGQGMITITAIEQALTELSKTTYYA